MLKLYKNHIRKIKIRDYKSGVDKSARSFGKICPGYVRIACQLIYSLF